MNLPSLEACERRYDEDVKSANDVQPQTSSVFDLNGRKQKTMLRGINIIKMSDGTTKKVIKQ